MNVLVIYDNIENGSFRHSHAFHNLFHNQYRGHNNNASRFSEMC